MDTFLTDLRHSLRLLLKNPGLAATCVLTLGLGIGLSAVMFSIINGSLLQPLPFEDPGRLMMLWRSNPDEGIQRNSIPIHDLEDWEAQQTSFEELGGWYSGTVNMTFGEDRPERFDGAFCQPAIFRVVKTQPLLGRMFTEEELRSEAPHVTVIGYALWQERFGGDPGVLGRSVRVNGMASTIIGVMPEGFVFPENDEVWVPQRQDSRQLERGNGIQFTAMGRLRQDVSLAQARTEFEGISARLAEQYPDTNKGIVAVIASTGDSIMDAQSRVVIWVMQAAFLAILMIACINVANLLLARAIVRSREVAVRTSLGATPRRIIGMMLLEATLLAVAGALVGLILGHFGISYFDRAIAFTDPPWWFDFSINGRVVLFVLGLTLFAALVSGLLPALQASRTDINTVLKDESRGATGFRMSRFSRGLVVVEIAFSIGLLFAAGLMTRSVLKLSRFDFGVDMANVLTARVGLFEGDYPTVENRRQFWRELQQRMEAMPGVVSATLTPYLPVRGSNGGPFMVQGEEYDPNVQYPVTRLKPVTPGYFETMGIPVLKGRALTEADIDGPIVAVVNQAFVDRYLDGKDPIGLLARGASPDPNGPWFEVVGVVGNEYTDTENENPAVAYYSMYLDDFNFVSLALKTRGDPLSFIPALRDVVVSLDPNLPIYWTRTLKEAIEENTWAYSVFGWLMIVGGAAALFLAAVGLYGVMAFTVGRRTLEIGVRMALGADAGRVVRLIVRQGSVQLLVGGGLGAVLAFLLGKALGLMLFGIEPSDPVTLAIVMVVLLSTGALATLIPAWRATRVDPVEALRQS
jgi:putative ABC transport system permease protein